MKKDSLKPNTAELVKFTPTPNPNVIELAKLTLIPEPNTPVFQGGRFGG
ncbi:MAG: hypothetical protein LWY06_17670 [Firmicutes bacterium]|nr:hypothetical protein [Bacillota bacterium]